MHVPRIKFMTVIDQIILLTIIMSDREYDRQSKGRAIPLPS